MIRSVRLRLTLQSVAVTALVVALLGVAVHLRARAVLYERIDRTLEQRARAFVGLFSAPGVRGTETALATTPNPLAATGPGGPRLLDAATAQTVTAPLGEPPLSPGTFADAIKTGQPRYVTVAPDYIRVRALYQPLRRDGRVVRVAEYRLILTETDRALDALTATLVTLAPGGLALALLVGWFLTDAALRPVRQATEAASRLGATDLSQRLPVTGGDEFAELAGTFNAMLGRVEAAFQEQQRFIGDASHELRTPLTVIKANASLALKGERTPDEYRERLRAVERAASTMQSLVEDLLLLARADAGQLVAVRQPVALAALLNGVAESLNALSERPPVTVVVPDGLSVFGDEDQLRRLFLNLADNAGKHTPPDGTVTLSAEAFPNGKAVIVQVRDTGEGIAPEHLPHLTERFYRADSSRAGKGTGLGLAIARQIAEAHGGTLSFESEPGVGTTVTVTLPKAQT